MYVRFMLCARDPSNPNTLNLEKENKTKPYFKVYDLREGINERWIEMKRKKNTQHAKHVIFLSFVRYAIFV